MEDENVVTSSECCSAGRSTVRDSEEPMSLSNRGISSTTIPTDQALSTVDTYNGKWDDIQNTSVPWLIGLQATIQNSSGQLANQITFNYVSSEFMGQHSRTEGSTNVDLFQNYRLGDSKESRYGNLGEDFHQDRAGGSRELLIYRQPSDTRQDRSQHNTNHEIKPDTLVKILAECPHLCSSLQDLMKLRNLEPSSVRQVALNYPYIFDLKGEEVELKPEVRICKAHCGSNGCPNRESCCGLHICKDYIMEKCHNLECVFGHKWNTGHNSSILRNLYIRDISSHILQKLLQAKELISASNDLIAVCYNYNENRCHNNDCTSLHICLTFIDGLAKGNFSACPESCLLNHDLLNSGCLQLLEKYGLPTNETPRDIVHSLVSANPFLFHEGKGNIKCKGKDASQDTEVDNTSPSDANVCERRGTKRKQNSLEFDSDDVQTVAIYNSPLTRWSHDLKGDVIISEICFNSVESKCDNERSGCERLHACLHFHWQVSEHGNQWLNLRPAQVKCLERAFCDPSKDRVTLPCLDPASLDNSLKSLFILMGRDIWSANFNFMNLANPTKTKNLYIRRLCTERIEGEKVKPSTYQWYFCDQNNVWVQYGKTDTLGETNLTSSMTSEQIEAMFLQDPCADITLSNFKFTYTLSFRCMVQINQTTGRRRQVMRRPEPHLQCEGMEDLPQTWKVVLSTERVLRVSLPDTSTEFKKILDLFNQNHPINYTVINIERIQHPYLWRAFQNKVKEMTAIHGSAGAVDLRYLFHGTNAVIVKNICEENFDWRLHGAKHGELFGHGTYFATSAAYSYAYTRADVTGWHFMFVAKVAVGSKVKGDPTMSRPPINPSTSLPYDSTVNNVQNPTIIVKYDKQEYYPEYLIMFW